MAISKSFEGFPPREGSSRNRVLLPLLLLTVLSTLAASFLFGELLLPLAAALLAAVIALEPGFGRSRLYTVLTVVAVILSDALMTLSVPYLAIEICAVAFIIAALSRRGVQKGECVFYVSVALTLFAIAALAIVAFGGAGEISVTAFRDYYLALYGQLREMFVDAVASAIERTQTGLSVGVADVVAMFDGMVALLPSVVLTCIFILSGITLKIYSGVLSRVCSPKVTRWLRAWRFSVPKLLYIAFWVFTVLSIFMGDMQSDLSIIVVNVATVLNVIFAYLGIWVAYYFLMGVFRGRGALAVTVIAFAFLFMGTVAVDLLAIFGAIITPNNRVWDNDN